MRLSKYLSEWVLYRRLRSCEQSPDQKWLTRQNKTPRRLIVMFVLDSTLDEKNKTQWDGEMPKACCHFLFFDTVVV